MSSISTLFSTPLTLLGTHTLIQSFLSPFVFLLLAVFYHHFFRTKVLTFGVKSIIFSLGFSFGVICYIRVDSLLLICTLILLWIIDAPEKLTNLSGHHPHWKQEFPKTLSHLLLGVASGMVLLATDDYFVYNKWFASPMQWIKFNVISGNAAAVFGSSEALTYIGFVLNIDFLTRLKLIVIVGLVGWILCWETTKQSKLSVAYLKMCCGLVVILFIYSTVTHKELRFLHDVFVLVEICFALSISVLVERYRMHAAKKSNSKSELLKKGIIFSKTEVATNHNHKYLYRVVEDHEHSLIITLLLILSIFCNKHFPIDDTWCYNKIVSSGHLNNCLEFVGRQQDSHGVFINSTIHMTAGYTALHKNITILALMQQDYHEYSIDKFYFKTPLGVQTGNISIFNRPNNVIHITNQHYLIKYLLENEILNYYIVNRSSFQWICADHKNDSMYYCDTTSERTYDSYTNFKLCNCDVMPSGLSIVFSSGDYQVIKRSDHLDTRVLLHLLESRYFATNDPAALLHEGSWLYTFGLLDQAKRRLEPCLVLTPKSTRVYQLLALIYRDAGQLERMQIILKLCFSRIGKKECLQNF